MCIRRSRSGISVPLGLNTPYPEGVAKFIDWYEATQEWYEPLVLAS
jgi:hypothetical protein